MSQYRADSETDICNLALGHCKADGIADINQKHNKGAAECRKYYALVRDALLEGYRWNFNTRRVTFSPATLPKDTYKFTNAYHVGNGVARVLEVDGCADDEWVVEDGLLLVSRASPLKGRVGVYIAEPSKYSAAFIRHFSYDLAHEIGPNMTHDEKTLARIERRSERLGRQAKKNDAREAREELPETVSEYVSARAVP